MACLSYVKYHGVILWNEVAVDWLSVGIWFGTVQFSLVQFSWRENATRGLVLLLFVAQTTWFGIPNFCNAKGEWVEHGIEDLVLLIHLK